MSEYIYATNGKVMDDEDGLISIPREHIVRCRDCEDYYHWEYTDGRKRNVCTRFECVEVTPDGFCAWGVRRN